MLLTISQNQFLNNETCILFLRELTLKFSTAFHNQHQQWWLCHTVDSVRAQPGVYPLNMLNMFSSAFVYYGYIMSF